MANVTIFSMFCIQCQRNWYFSSRLLATLANTTETKKMWQVTEILFQYILKPFTVFSEFESVTVPSMLPISKLHIRFFEKSIWHFDMTAQSKTPAGYCLYHFSVVSAAKSFKTTTFLCEYLRCRIVRKHCKKFIAKVGSEIISRTTFLHLDTKWEWPRP